MRFILVAAALLLLVLWWLWPTAIEEVMQSDAPAPNENKHLVSTIQPITAVDETPDQGIASLAIPSPNLTSQGDAASLRQLKNGLSRARQAINDDAPQTAINVLDALIEQHPQYVEPYINLASVYAANGQLPKARQTLIQGLNANKHYATLFTNLQKIHGALAANAYHAALAEKDDTITKVELPLIDSIDDSYLAVDVNETITLQQLESYKEQLGTTHRDLVQTNAKLMEKNNKLKTLEAQLVKITNSNLELQQKLQASLVTANANARQSRSAQTQTRALQSQLVNAKQRIKTMQNQHKSELTALQQRLQQQPGTEDLFADQNQGRAATSQAAAKQDQPDSAAVSVSAQTQQLAIDLVKSWAEAWSGQRVDDYIAHYADHYSPPGANMDHATWAKQRRVRLTNKAFIEVDVTEFDVQWADKQLVVTFYQHYRSDTIDDKIRKQLLLATDANNRKGAKIVSERVLQ